MAQAPTRYETSLGRAVGALCLGALTGAGLVASGGIALASAQLFGPSKPSEFLLIIAIGFFPALLVYAAGLGLVAAPAWAALHAIRVRSWYAAMLLGAFLNGGVMLLVQGASIRSLPAIFVIDAVFAVFGAIVGWVIWRAAYRRRLDIDALSETLS